MEKFVEYLIGEGVGDRTIEIYLRHVAVAERWFTKRGKRLDAAAPSELRAFAKDAIRNTNSSRRQATVALKHYWTWKGLPTARIKAITVPPKEEMVCRAVDEDEAAKLVRVALEYGYPKGWMVLAGMYLALRRTEIATMEWERFSPDMKWYTVIGKGQKTATLPVHEVVRTEFAARKTGYIFPGRLSAHVSPATVWDWSKQVARAAGLEHFTTHQLRHTALTTANDNTGDLRAVQTFARHSKPSTTAGYTRTKQTRLREVSDSLDYL